MNSKSKQLNGRNLETINSKYSKYIVLVYSHALFLYSITKAHKYKIMQEKESNNSEIDIEVYLKDLFETHYADFLLNFGFDEIMSLLEE